MIYIDDQKKRRPIAAWRNSIMENVQMNSKMCYFRFISNIHYKHMKIFSF